MDFDHTEELTAVKRLAREFAEKEIRPHVGHWDENQTIPREVLARLGEIGFMGVLAPPQHGGSGLGYLEYIAIVEELSRVDGAVGLSVAAHNSLCVQHILAFGTEAQRLAFAAPLARGQMIGAWALTEPQAGSDAASMQTTARLTGNHWVLDGQKSFTTHGTIADVYVVLAVTDRAARHRGISAFLVERGTPGFRSGRKENKLGLRACDTASVFFDHCCIARENLIGEAGHGFIDAMMILDGGRISIVALALGIAQGAFDAALNYATQRKQFGRPICEFQAIQFKLADMAVEIQAARLLTQRAAWMKDQGMDITQESSVAKLYASEVAVRVAT
jgi:alkylation response protein AidB-like acyl-CoA dehydrogenase